MTVGIVAFNSFAEPKNFPNAEISAKTCFDIGAFKFGLRFGFRRLIRS